LPFPKEIEIGGSLLTKYSYIIIYALVSLYDKRYTVALGTRTSLVANVQVERNTGQWKVDSLTHRRA